MSRTMNIENDTVNTPDDVLMEYVCLDLRMPGLKEPLATQEIPIVFDNDRKINILDRGEVHKIFSDTLTKIEHIISTQPEHFINEHESVYVGTVGNGIDTQLSLSISLAPNVSFWINSAMSLYGISGILLGEIHGLQKTIDKPSLIYAANSILTALIKR